MKQQMNIREGTSLQKDLNVLRYEDAAALRDELKALEKEDA